MIRVPADPQEIVVRPDARLAFVSCDETKQVVAIDLPEGKLEKFYDVGAGAGGRTWVRPNER